jgi:type II secretion system protein C
MNLAVQERWGRGLGLAVWLGVVALALAWLLFALRSPDVARQPAPLTPAQAVAWPKPAVPQDADWAVVRRVQGKGGVTVVNSIAQRFRLAGTFSTFDGTAAESEGERRAVIDDLQKQSEYLLREGEAVEGLSLLKIFHDHVLVQINGKEEELRLSFTDTLASGATSTEPTATNEVVLSTSRFGKRIAENRWVMSRESLMQYYEELRKDPERVLQLFDSLKPSYNQDQHINGYRLGMEGEKEFFQAVGLQDGDVVRQVNSINMTSQKRAEYLIGEFLQNRLSALVFDIERENKPQKLIYFVR